ncbi:hypothetical protein LY78DRAFT_380704 [Colletotrichum sublineola]|nr:hypothetical protein LY78DRAFT_380704 [Colletotrichum sublineola]
MASHEQDGSGKQTTVQSSVLSRFREGLPALWHGRYASWTSPSSSAQCCRAAAVSEQRLTANRNARTCVIKSDGRAKTGVQGTLETRCGLVVVLQAQSHAARSHRCGGGGGGGGGSNDRRPRSGERGDQNIYVDNGRSSIHTSATRHSIASNALR